MCARTPHAHTLTNLCSFQDEVVDTDLLLIGQTEPVLTDEGDSECLTVHSLLSTGPVHKLILCLHESTDTVSCLCLYINNVSLL